MMEVKIIVYGLSEEEEKDSLTARMVKKRIEDMEAEFENNGIPTRVILR